MNENLKHLGEYRLEVFTAGMQRCTPVFCDTLKHAKETKKTLKESGYIAYVLKVVKGDKEVFLRPINA